MLTNNLNSKLFKFCVLVYKGRYKVAIKRPIYPRNQHWLYATTFQFISRGCNDIPRLAAGVHQS